jgi:ceramide glucosyltransferase
MEIFTSLSSFTLTLIDTLLFILCLSALSFYSYAIYTASSFFSHPPAIDPDFHPPVTILKPICGADSDAYENLASFCRQQYSVYQIIFSVLDPEDTGIAVVRQIIRDFPERDLQLVIDDRRIGTNLKVSNLANAVTQAHYEILLIADSDIRVETDYLQRVIQPLREPQVGVVTCLYRSLARGWVATWEALGTASEFPAGVLVSRQLEGVQFAFGSTLVIRKNVLETIGGFAAIADYLADDFQLGYLSAQAGWQVVLSDVIVEHTLTGTTLAESIQRQLRWARVIRVSRPWGYAGLIFTYGTVTSLLLLMAMGGSAAGWSILGITWMMRLTMGWIVGANYLNDLATKAYWWLIPLRDLERFAIWCYGFFGNTIQWRGQRLQLTKEGKLLPVNTAHGNSESR